MLPAAEERTPALTSVEEIFSLAAGVALAALDMHQGAREAQGKKPHQGIFSKKRALRVSPMWAKWSGTHQDRKCSWSETVSGSALDANGNMLTDASGKSYTWDFENRLTQAVVPGTNGGTTIFKYDPFGRRIYKQSPNFTSIFVYDGVNLIESFNASGAEVASYTQNEGIDEALAAQRSSTTDYYEADALGSITSLSSPAGTLANTYTYDSFGNMTASTGTVRNYFHYTGREFDTEAGTYEYRLRYYDPNVGRFISEDPIGIAGGINTYSYVRNRITVLSDPFGLCPTEPSKPKQPCYSGTSFTDKAVRFFSLVRLPETIKEWVLGGAAKYGFFWVATAGAKSAGGAESAGAVAIGFVGEGFALAGSVAMVGATMTDIDCQIGPVEPYTDK